MSDERYTDEELATLAEARPDEDSPLPWVRAARGPIDRVTDANGYLVADGQAVYDVAFIVTACNHHGRLVAELQAARVERDEARAWVRRLTVEEAERPEFAVSVTGEDVFAELLWDGRRIGISACPSDGSAGLHFVSRGGGLSLFTLDGKADALRAALLALRDGLGQQPAARADVPAQDDADKLRTERDVLLVALGEACEGWEEANTYVDRYHREKWGLDTRVAEIRKLLPEQPAAPAQEVP